MDTQPSHPLATYNENPAHSSQLQQQQPQQELGSEVSAEATPNAKHLKPKPKISTAFQPSNTPFKQQRQRAWQPVLSSSNVIPSLWLLTLLFIPFAAVFVATSSTVKKLTIEYTNCDELSPSESAATNVTYKGFGNTTLVTPPQHAFNSDTKTCSLSFTLPSDLTPPVFFYYKLTSYHQNHRRYIKSISLAQLKGDAPSAAELNKGDCKPITSRNNKPVYPCGLMANSFFNDTFTNLTRADDNQRYEMTEKGIVWHNEKKRYKFPSGYPSNDSVVPPPNWAIKFPQYDDETPIPNLSEDEHFQVWMKPAAYPDFEKLYMKNEHEKMPAGRYQISIEMNYPVKSFGSTKSIVFSTVNWTGGRNSFLGWAYLGAAITLILFAIYFSVRQIWRRRNPPNLFNRLSWNRKSNN